MDEQEKPQFGVTPQGLLWARRGSTVHWWRPAGEPRQQPKLLTLPESVRARRSEER